LPKQQSSFGSSGLAWIVSAVATAQHEYSFIFCF
jgi:hypothetical protein